MARPLIARSCLSRLGFIADPLRKLSSQDEERRVLPEQLGVRLAAKPSGSAGVVLPARLEGDAGDVELILWGGVLAEHERDLGEFS